MIEKELISSGYDMAVLLKTLGIHRLEYEQRE
jgi:hypothetical protein